MQELIYVVILKNRFGHLSRLSKVYEDKFYLTPEKAWEAADAAGPNWTVYEVSTLSRQVCKN